MPRAGRTSLWDNTEERILGIEGGRMVAGGGRLGLGCCIGATNTTREFGLPGVDGGEGVKAHGRRGGGLNLMVLWAASRDRRGQPGEGIRSPLHTCRFEKTKLCTGGDTRLKKEMVSCGRQGSQ